MESSPKTQKPPQKLRKKTSKDLKPTDGILPFKVGMTREKWMENLFYRNEFRRFTESEIWSHFRAVLLNCLPAGFLPGANLSEIQAARELGRIEGWREVMSLMDDLTQDIPTEPTETEIINDSLNYARSDNFKP